MTQRNNIVQHDLADLASQIKARHKKAEDCAREAVGHALEAGKPQIAFFYGVNEFRQRLFYSANKNCPRCSGKPAGGNRVGVLV